ncbi:fibronectin type III domain-containing protein [Ensifer adhaerens]|uniref:fibronectin type III domain-containing protein n=1 Tax=Ensifer adhaerens TaxID=106592 RepID=UPI000CF0EB3C|nr:fibronectin type III domain-containing protein [Ensifer adhaerens]
MFNSLPCATAFADAALPMMVFRLLQLCFRAPRALRMLVVGVAVMCGSAGGAMAAPCTPSISFSSVGLMVAKNFNSCDVVFNDTPPIWAGPYKVQGTHTDYQPPVGIVDDGTFRNPKPDDPVGTAIASYGFTFDSSTGTDTIRLLEILNPVATSDTIVLYSHDAGGAPHDGSVVRAPQTNTISVTLPNAFPTISSVSPTTGSPTGGTSVTITGSGFTGATSVKFGSASATSFTVDSATQITAVAPAGAAGPADIVVTTGSGTVTLASGFNYLVVPPGAPTIGTVTPLDPEAAYVYFTPPADTGGGTITEYVVTSSPHGKTGVGTQSPIVVPGLWNGTSYTFTVRAKNAAGAGPASAASQAVTPKSYHFIAFNPGPQTFGTTPILSATNTSGMPVVFSSTTPDICTVTSYGELTFHSAGTCTINADAEGNEAYHPAQVTRSFAVNPALPGAPTIGTVTPLDPEAAYVYFTPPADTGGGTITEYVVTSSPHGKTGVGTQSPIVVPGLWNGTSYTFTVRAKNAAGAGPASAASQAVTPKSYHFIAFNPGPQTFGTTPILSATNTSGMPVVFSSTTPDICTVTSYGELTFHSAGTCTINADAEGNEAYHPAQVTRSFAVNPALPGAPTIGAATAGDTQANVSFIAPAYTGGAPVTYIVTANPGGATGTGASSPVTVAGLTNGVAYTFTVTATNAVGTGGASAASNSITPAAAQTITFVNPGGQDFGTMPILTATSDSGLLPTFTSSTEDVCTITSIGQLTFASVGTCTINANQQGNAAYLPAAEVSHSFAVQPVIPGAPLIGSATAGDTQATITFTPPASDGGSAVIDYIVTVNPGGATFTGPSSPITATALTNGTAYTFTVAATTAAGTGAPSAASNAVTPVAAQFITFANPGSQTVGIVSTLTATTSSGLTPVFTSSTPGVCAITGSATLTPVAVGTCTISVDQPGNAAYLAAPTVTQSFAINPPLPTAGNVSATVAANSTANPITLSLSGGAADSVAVTAAPSHGTATASGTAISYAPDPGYSGADSFTYTATNATGTSAPATVTVTVSAPTFAFTPAAGALGAGTVGSAYSQSISAANGTAPYLYAISTGALPSGLHFDTSSGAITGAPTTEGTYGFTIAATDAHGAIGAASYTLSIGRQVPAVGNVSTTVAANSTANLVTLSLSGGVADSVAVAAAPSHGTATASGMAISYTPDPDYSGVDSFTYTATNTTGASAPATVNITVVAPKLIFSPSGGDLPDAMAGEAYSAMVTAKGGQGGILYSHTRGDLPRGMVLNVSTGELTGPLPADAEVKTYSFAIAARDPTGNTGEASYRLAVKARGVTVTNRSYTLQEGEAPRNVYLNAGATGGPFNGAGIAFVRPSNAGKAEIIEGELAASGSFVPVGYYLKFTPNPGFFGTAVVGYRLESALGASNTGTISYAIVHNGDKVAAEIDGLVRDFVRTRQNLLSAAIEVPGLIERRKMGRAGSDPISTSMSPSEDGMTLGFSTSLAQLRSADEAGEGGDGAAAVSPFNAWIDGTVAVHKRDENGGRWGSFGLISAGADYLLSEKALVGLSFHFDRITDPTDVAAELTGNGWLAGPYASFELGSGVFLDTSLLYGGSWNDVDTKYFDGSFETRRVMWDTKLQGHWQLGDATVLTPALRAVFLNEEVDDYSVSNDDGSRVDLQGFTQDQLRFSIGAELERSYQLDNGMMLTPRLGGTAGFAALDSSGAFGTVSAGLNLSNNLNWDFDLSLLYGIESKGEQTIGAKAGVQVRF